jgi:hypothetical protein
MGKQAAASTTPLSDSTKCDPFHRGLMSDE